jgi:WD40 repeat protein
MIAGAGDDGMVRAWDATSLRLTWELPQGDPAVAIGFSTDGKTLACTAGDEVVLRDAATGEERRRLPGHGTATGDGRRQPERPTATGRRQQGRAGFQSLAFSPVGVHLATGDSEGVLVLWNAKTGHVEMTLERHQGGVSSVAFSSDGRLVASGSDDKTINVWEVGTGKLRWSLKAHEIAVYSVAFSPDGRVIAAGTGNDGLVFWDAQTGKLRRVLSQPRVPLRTN